MKKKIHVWVYDDKVVTREVTTIDGVRVVIVRTERRK
jgi:hypothetical protein